MMSEKVVGEWIHPKKINEKVYGAFSPLSNRFRAAPLHPIVPVDKFAELVVESQLYQHSEDLWSDLRILKWSGK